MNALSRHDVWLLVMLAGCGGSAPDGSGAEPSSAAPPAAAPAVPAANASALPVATAPADGCDKYLTTVEINSACGTSLGSYEGGSATPCDRTYHVTADSLLAYSIAGPAGPMARKVYDSVKDARKMIVETQAGFLPGKTVFEAVPGLGDDSYRSDAGNGQLNVNFIKGEHSVYLLADPGLCKWEALLGLARTIAGRLP